MLPAAPSMQPVLRVIRVVKELVVSLGWVAVALSFSALSLGFIVGVAWLIRLALPFLPDFSVIFAFLLAFIIYIVLVVWLGWKLLRRKLRI